MILQRENRSHLINFLGTILMILTLGARNSESNLALFQCAANGAQRHDFFAFCNPAP